MSEDIVTAAGQWERASTALLAAPFHADLAQLGHLFATLRIAEQALTTAVRLHRENPDDR